MERPPVFARYADRVLENNSVSEQSGRKLLPACCVFSGLDDSRPGQFIPGQVATALQPCPVAALQPRPNIRCEAPNPAAFPQRGLLLGKHIPVELSRHDCDPTLQRNPGHAAF
jgi:hypothetical protein